MSQIPKNLNYNVFTKVVLFHNSLDPFIYSIIKIVVVYLKVWIKCCFFLIFQPTTEMFVTAYNFYHTRIKSMCFGAWLHYYLDKKNKKKTMLRKIEEARRLATKFA